MNSLRNKLKNKLKNRKGFTLIEVIITMVLFAMIMIIVISLLNFVLGSTTESQRSSEVIANNSSTKELLIRTLEPATAVEVLSPISSNDLSSYTSELDDDDKYSYLYTLDGDVYYRGAGGGDTGKIIPMLSTTDVDLGFLVNDINPKTLEVNMTFTSKEVDPYVLSDELLISPLNLQENMNGEVVVTDNRTDKTVPSNIIRFISSEIIITDVPEASDGLQIISIEASEDNSGIGDKVDFTVSQEPREVNLVYDTTYVNKSTSASGDQLDNFENPVDPSAYYENTVIRQSKYMANLTSPRKLTIKYRGQYFIDSRGIVLEGGEPDADGVRTLEYALPVEQYEMDEELHFAVTSTDGEYLPYDWNVVTSVPEPQIVKFEFLQEDNYTLQNGKDNITHDIKTYINQNDVYYADNSLNPGENYIEGASETEGKTPGGDKDYNSAPEKFPSITSPGPENTGSSFYSTIVLPLNKKHDKYEDYYPSVGDKAHRNGTNYLTTRVATVTFKGTELYDPTGKSIPIPPSERSKLNGVSEVTVKVSVDVDSLGNVYYLDGELVDELNGVTDKDVLNQYNAYTNGNQDWFDYNTQPIFTVSTLDDSNVKRYVYQKEYGTTTPDYHEGTNVDAGLTKVWVDGYLDGAWVGGSMRGRVADPVEISYPYDKMSELDSDLVISASAYGEYLAYLPAYVNGTFDAPKTDNGNGKSSRNGNGNSSKGSDNIGYYKLDPTENTTISLLESSDVSVNDNPENLNIAYPNLNESSTSLKHLVVLQSLGVNNAVTPYTIKVVPEYPVNVRKPEVINIRANEIISSTDGTWNLDATQPANYQRNYFKGENTFSTNNSLDKVYYGSYINLDIAFSGSKIEISNSMNPNDEIVLRVENPLASDDSTKENGKEFAYMATLKLPYSNEYYIHLYDYNGKVCNTYRVLQNTTSNWSSEQTRMRTTDVYNLSSEVSKNIGSTGLNDTSNLYNRAFVPIKTSVEGASYGYDLDLPYSDSILDGDVSSLSSTFELKKFPFYFSNDDNFDGVNHYNYFMSHAGGEDSSKFNPSNPELVRDDYISTNYRSYNGYNGSGEYNNKYKVFIKSTLSRYYNSYTLGGNNLSTMPVYNVSTMMTPIRHDEDLNAVGTYDTDRFMGDTDRSNTRPEMKPESVKFDEDGFMVHIRTDRPIDKQTSKNYTSLQGFGRPGATTMTTFDMALVDKDEFYTDLGMETVMYAPFNDAESNNQLYSDKIKFNNNPVYRSTDEMTNNDIIGFGFALVENNVDRDFTQNYLGADYDGVSQKSDTKREVSLMFYTRQFFFEDGEVSLPKSPATFVKICDLEGFDSSTYTNYNNEFVMNTQDVNFNVDVRTTFDGNTKITKDNYETIMNNNYIEFTVVEMDYANKGNINVDYQRYSFADVFGGVRVDDEYRELNLLLNQIPRVEGEEVYLSTGYNTNYGTVGISDFSILK